MNTDSRRCWYCRRLCRYFGQNSFGLCGICDRWCLRNRYIQTRDACSVVFANGRLAQRNNKLIWTKILQMLVGSDWEDEMFVEERIWRQVLLGYQTTASPSSSSDDEEPHGDMLVMSPYHGLFPLNRCSNPFWTLWGCEILSQDFAQRSVARYNHRFRYERIICVVIAFLGPFCSFHFSASSFGIKHLGC